MWTIQVLTPLGDFTGPKDVEAALNRAYGDIYDEDLEDAGIELSVTKIGSHGEASEGNGSYGWPGDDKIILIDPDSSCDYSPWAIQAIFEAGVHLLNKLNEGGRENV